MKVKELIEKLQQLDPEARVYVDYDMEGDNENEADKVVEFKSWLATEKAVKIIW